MHSQQQKIIYTINKKTPEFSASKGKETISAPKMSIVKENMLPLIVPLLNFSNIN